MGFQTSVSGTAEPAPFDLAGPIVEVTVTRNGKTLPVFQVPNLAVGDRIAVVDEGRITGSADSYPGPNAALSAADTRCARTSRGSAILQA